MAASATAPLEAPRATYHHGNLEEALIQRALEVLEAQGVKALSVRKIARDVGVSQTAPLHYFQSKTGFYAAIAEHGFALLFECRVQALRNKRDPRERLLAIMMSYLDFASRNEGLFDLMFGSEIPDKSVFPTLEAAATRSYGVFETCMADYLALRGIDLDKVRVATLSAWTACHGLATMMTHRQNTPRDLIRKDRQRIGQEVFAITLAGIDSL